MQRAAYKRIGHKGADSIVEGNTLESFEAAVEHGVDVIEIDVLRDRDSRLVLAHDHEDAASRRPLELSEALDAFLQPPLDQVEINCDLKLVGGEAELAGALAGHDLLERAMVSTMEVESLTRLGALEPDLRLGLTIPKTTRDWTQHAWAMPVVAASLALMRSRFPATVGSRVSKLGLRSIWAYHRLISPKLVAAAESASAELFAWTVDDAGRIAELEAMGVHGICSNDPRLFNGVASAPAPGGDDSNASD